MLSFWIFYRPNCLAYPIYVNIVYICPLVYHLSSKAPIVWGAEVITDEVTTAAHPADLRLELK